MDPSAALSELLELSTQVVEVVVTGADGSVEAARTSSNERSTALAAAGTELIRAASSFREGGPAVARVHVDLERGSLVVVGDGRRTIAATTVAEPTASLVAYDLRTALGRLRGDAA